MDVATFTMTTEQREHVVEWIADLRSGQFRQGYGKLNSDDEFCCLGVGALTAARCGLVVSAERLEMTTGRFQVRYDGNYDVWGSGLTGFFGFGSNNPTIGFIPCDDQWCHRHRRTGIHLPHFCKETDCDYHACCPDMGQPCERLADDLAGVYCHPLVATNANDDKRWTLEQIADAVEATYITGTPLAAQLAASELGGVNFDLKTGLWRS